MQQYVIFNVLKEYCIPKEEEEELKTKKQTCFLCHSRTNESDK